MLTPQTSHFTVIKLQTLVVNNKFVDKANHLPEDRFIITSCTVWAAFSPLMSALHLPAVNEPGCAVVGYFPRNTVPLVEDVPADRTEQK